LKKSNDGKSMATSGHCDKLVKVWNIESRSEMWANNLGGSCLGISWVPGDTYLITMTHIPSKVVIVSGRDGKTLMEFTTGFTRTLQSLVVSLKSKMILVGDGAGQVHELKMVE
jgi:WD40 repeat protein